MNQTRIQLDPGATMPTRAHESDVGYDVTACKVEYCNCMDETAGDDDKVYSVKIDTGIHVTPPAGYHFELMANSRLAKTGFYIPNGLGLIDPGYTGSIRMVLRGYEHLECVQTMFAPGKVCGQLVLRKTHSTVFVQVDKLQETQRGNGGFGSTEKKGDQA